MVSGSVLCQRAFARTHARTHARAHTHVRATLAHTLPESLHAKHKTSATGTYVATSKVEDDKVRLIRF